MKADTIQGHQVVLGMAVSQALWAAMFEDDDLAHDYLQVALVHALNHIVHDVGPEPYTRDEWMKLTTYLREARKECASSEEGMTARWTAYAEPPF